MFNISVFSLYINKLFLSNKTTLHIKPYSKNILNYNPNKFFSKKKFNITKKYFKKRFSILGKKVYLNILKIYLLNQKKLKNFQKKNIKIKFKKKVKYKLKLKINRKKILHLTRKILKFNIRKNYFNFKKFEIMYRNALLFLKKI